MDVMQKAPQSKDRTPPPAYRSARPSANSTNMHVGMVKGYADGTSNVPTAQSIMTPEDFKTFSTTPTWRTPEIQKTLDGLYQKYPQMEMPGVYAASNHPAAAPTPAQAAVSVPPSQINEAVNAAGPGMIESAQHWAPDAFKDAGDAFRAGRPWAGGAALLRATAAAVPSTAATIIHNIPGVASAAGGMAGHVASEVGAGLSPGGLAASAPPVPASAPIAPIWPRTPSAMAANPSATLASATGIHPDWMQPMPTAGAPGLVAPSAAAPSAAAPADAGSARQPYDMHIYGHSVGSPTSDTVYHVDAQGHVAPAGAQDIGNSSLYTHPELHTPADFVHANLLHGTTLHQAQVLSGIMAQQWGMGHDVHSEFLKKEYELNADKDAALGGHSTKYRDDFLSRVNKQVSPYYSQPLAPPTEEDFAAQAAQQNRDAVLGGSR